MDQIAPMTQAEKIELVSIHGGHSGQFCNHAQDTLEDIVKAYIDLGFSWVGITEHMPPISDDFLYEEEIEAGLNAEKMYTRFGQYISTCRELQRKYVNQLEIFVGIETEVYSNTECFIHKLIAEFKPDYIVGSLHHVDDMSFDLSKKQYLEVAAQMGGLEALYCRYFDQQYEMINVLKPRVVGHFDYIRMFDPEYQQRLQQPDIVERIRRNLRRIKELDLILDFNVSPLRKGASEPNPTKSVLLEARELGIPVVPGDDSHAISQVGLNIDKGITILQELGFDIKWTKPIS